MGWKLCLSVIILMVFFGPSTLEARECRECEVNGKTYRGHSRFSYRQGCNKYRCTCRCDGSYHCPPKYTIPLCSGNKKTYQTSSSSASSSFNTSSSKIMSSASGASSSSSVGNTGVSHNYSSSSRHRDQSQRATGCRNCLVNGTIHKGNTYFTHTDRCIKFNSCLCQCDGSWSCPPERTVFICGKHGENTNGKGTGKESESKANLSSGSSHNTTNLQEGSRVDREPVIVESRIPDRCLSCFAGGIERRGNSYFDLDETCVRYRYCLCRCNGSWNCPERYAVNTCREQSSGENKTATTKSQKSKGIRFSFESSTPKVNGQTHLASRCRNCAVQGQTYRGNSYFTHTDGCIKYNSCICQCDGSWSCPAERSVSICYSRRESIPSSGKNGSTITTDRKRKGNVSCHPCKVKNRTFPGDASFEVRNGCIQYSNCYCRCNGSWVCPDSGARNLCQTNIIPNCPGCEVNLKRYPGNAHFSIQYGCVNYTRCLCNCNGTWSCPKSGQISTCGNTGQQVTRTETSGGHNSSAQENVQRSSDTSESRLAKCQKCFVYGKRFNGGSRFEVTNGCMKYRNCICRCDGSWVCRPQFATDICRRNSSAVSTSGQTKERAQCLTCNAKGMIITGNTYFNMTDKCTQFTNCLCRCDGSWDCPAHYSKDICRSTRRLNERGPFGCINCNARGKIVKSGAKFTLIEGCLRYDDCHCNCDGSWKCSSDKYQNLCLNNTETSDGCLTCKASDGTFHPANAPFSFQKDCVEYNCDCHCNGSWNCPANRSRWACTDQCRGCDVEGKKVASNTTFTHKTGCLEYTCDCHCNGSWSCPGRSVRNTCPTGVNVNCNKCTVSPHEQYEGETNFVLRRDCLHYKCRCNCDGSYSCPGKDARNVCRGERLGGCRSCVVSEKEIYRGNTDFNFRKGCISYQCRCNCDGSWSCPAKDARDVCVGEVPGGCRVCRVSDTEIYRANTQFDLRKGCIHYKCQCNCDGGWKCPGKDARDVCKGEVPGGCRSCMISENEFYPGNSNFEMVKNCIHYKCRCKCNGGYNCPGKTAKRVCRNELSPLISKCRECQVSEKEKFQGNTTFYLERNCNRYECKCKCDGSWNCPAENTKKICSERLQSETGSRARQCRSCKVRNQHIPSESRFKLQRRCYQYDCECGCNGQFSCDSNRVNTCRQRQDRLGRPSVRSKAHASLRKDVLTNPVVTNSHEIEGGETHIETNIDSSRNLNKDNANHNNNNNNNNNNKNGSSSDNYNNNKNKVNNSRTRYEFTSKVESNQRKLSTNAGRKVDNKTRNRSHPLNYFTNNCRTCSVLGQVKQPNELFDLEVGCIKYKNCLCLCSGKHECAQEINVCDKSNTTVTNHREVPGHSGSSSSRRVTLERDLSSRKSTPGMSNTRAVEEKDKTVKIDRINKPTRVAARKRFINRGEITSSSHLSSSSSIPNNQDIPGRKYDVRHRPNTAPNNRSSSSSSSSSSSLLSPSSHSSPRIHETSASSSSSSSPGSQKKGSNAISRFGGCTECLADNVTYSPGAEFDMRRGCVIYKCACLCSGSYRCAVMSDNACTKEDRENSCSNCVYQGMVFPGGFDFKVRENCNEKTCKCRCNGTYTCPSTSILKSCLLGIQHNPAISSSSGSSFRSSSGGFPQGSGYIERTVKVHGPCTTNCQNSRVISSGNEFPVVAENTPGHNRACRSCMLEDRTHAGNSSFAIQKGCVYFDCFCDCGGSWTCTGRMSRECVPQNVPDNFPGNQQPSKCRNCLVQETEFPARSRFLLRQGCFEYKCSCNCDGSWVCPEQKPVNKCPSKPQRVNQERFEPFAIADDETSVSVSMSQMNEGQLSSHTESTVDSQQQHGNSERRGGPVITGSIPGCRRCFMHGQHVEPLAMFIKQEGCFETLCHCLCDGEASCPDSASINVCELPDQMPMGERPGCKVGRRMHYTRVFALVEDCYQRVCICHDNGTWTCKRSAQDKKVC